MFDVRLAGIELFDLVGVDIKTQHPVADLAIAEHERKTNIAETKNADHGLAAVEAINKFQVSVSAQRLTT
jgi:hypothetical protein